MAISKINTRALSNDSVTADKVADNAITTDMISSGQVDELLGGGDRHSPGITSVHSCQAGDDVVVWGDLQYGGHSS